MSSRSIDHHQTGDEIPLWPLGQAELADWLSGQPPAVANWVAANNFSAAANSHLMLADEQGHAAGVIVGLGDRAGLAGADCWGLAALPGSLPPGRYGLVAESDEKAAEKAAFGWLMGAYRFSRYRADADRPDNPEDSATLVMADSAGAREGRRLAGACGLVRDLVNTPASDMGPGELAAAASELADQHGAECRIVSGASLSRDFPAIEAVGRGSSRPPRLTDLRWGAPGAPAVTLVGKGICFDTGGLDLKPSAGMLLMKKDMGGAAHALGLARAIMKAGLDLRLRVIIPAAENSVAGNAYRPGDVIGSRHGISIEIGNTDAEGRLVLADALSLAAEEKPLLLLDFATLTGAARVALGADLPALFSNDDGLAGDLLAAGGAVSDPLWRLPLWQPYAADLDSKVADINNVSASGFAGAITAALFLQRFVDDDIRWAHMDVFAWNRKDRPGRPTGGDAFGLRAAFSMLKKQFPAG